MHRNEQLEQLKNLLESGVLTQAEFDEKVAMLPPEEAPAAPNIAVAPAAPVAPVAQAPFPANPASSIPKKTKASAGVILYVLGVLDGLFSVIMGLIAYGLADGSWESNVTYGGDAYTGIQNAAAQTANNVLYLTGAVRFVGGTLLIVVGVALIALFASKILKAKKQ